MTDTVQAKPPAMSAPFRINSDPLDWTHLPKPVRAKLRLLRSAKDDATILMHAASDERKRAWQEKQEAESRLTFLTGERQDSPYFDHLSNGKYYRLDDDHPSVVPELARLENVKAEIARLTAILDARSQVFNQVARLVTNVERYLGEGLQRVREKMAISDGPTPTLQKRETVVDAIERCRRRLRELNADRHRIASAPWHAADAKKRARIEIERLAERGMPSVLPLIETQDGAIFWPGRLSADVFIGGRAICADGDPNPLPVMFWLHREAIIAKIEAQIDEIADDESALTNEQRNKQIGEIERDRLAIEREEEFWVCAAIDDGMRVLRRSDVDPRAVLGLGDDMPSPPAD